MSRPSIRFAIGFISAALVLIPAPPASAHGGGADSNVTSNYRTRITDVPDETGLRVEIVDIDGTIELTWNGSGVIVVNGYENEPYLRIDGAGVYQNLRSPATYLNQDRYANVNPPETADATAPPDWQLLTTRTTIRWHDHRTHWMSKAPPVQVQEQPERSHVIIERWEIPLTIDGRPAVVVGDLTWTPPPALLVWTLVSIAIAALASWLLWTRWWRSAAAVLATIGTFALAVDTAGYVAFSSDNLANRIWTFVYAAIAAGAAVELFVHVRRRTVDPTLAMVCAGLVLGFLGGVDRFDVFTRSQVFSAVPANWTRVATALCLGIGIALTIRFLVFLVALSTHSSAPTTSVQERSPA